MTANLDEINRLLSNINREVWVITAAANGQRGGLTATWVSTASIDRNRPVLLAGLAPNHFTAELVQRSGRLVAHLLHERQVELAWNFARDSGRSRDKLFGLKVAESTVEAPILAECLAWFECQVFHWQDAGDRLFFWADILRAGEGLAGAPLREQTWIQSLTIEQRQHLAAGRQADLDLQRPLLDRWRRLVN